MKNKYYEPRYIKNSTNNIEFSLFEDENKRRLSDLLIDNDKIVLLGNPGIGKTTELELLFEKLSENKDESLNYPFYINLKNFRKNHKFEDLVPFENWNELPNVTFILDGLDEIAEIHDFLSELDFFLNKNRDRNIKVVLSCRTNIYEKYLVRIPEFNYYYIDTLTDKQINNILKKRINKELNNLELQKHRAYIENPFNLNLFIGFYESKGRFPETQNETWELFIESELEKLNKETFIKSSEIDIPHIKKCLEKIAFTSEIMQKNFINGDNLLELIGKEDKQIIEKISLIDRLPNSPNFVFRHKNYQEFFSAKYLSKLSIEEIISIIKISENINKTKPSLFNTITFLLNIIDIDKFKRLQEWIYKYEPEILFLAEKERINDIELQRKIFRKYFEDIAIKKTFWIGKNARFSLENISKFADIDFLIDIIKNKNYQFRAETSAYTILSFANLGDKKLVVKELFEEKLFSEIEEKRFVDDILRVIRNQEFHLEFKDFFENILKHFKETNDRDILHEIISMLNDIENIDDYFPYLYNGLRNFYEIKEKRERDNVIRGTKWILEKMFLKIKNPKNFIKILDIIFNRKYALNLSDFYDKTFPDKLVEKTNSFVEKDINYLFRIIDSFLRSEDTLIYRRDGFLNKLIEKSNKKLEIFKYLIENYGLTTKTFFLLSDLYTKESLDFFIDLYRDEQIKIENKNNIISFKNWIFSKDRSLGYYLESELQKIGFQFNANELLLSEEKLNKQEILKKEYTQKNWDIFFDKEILLSEIEKVFTDNEVEEMSWSKICDISHEMYIERDYVFPENSAVKTISRIIRDNGSQNFESIKHNLEDDYIWLSVLKEHLKHSDKDFQISDEQKQFIIEKCIQLSKNFEYDKVIKFSGKDNGSYSVYINFYVLKTLYFFDKRFDINYDKSFYLGTLKYCNIANFANDEVGAIEFIKERVTIEDDFNKQITKNINEEKLDYFSLKSHINYVIDNNLNTTFKKIGEYILEDKHLFSQWSLLERYVKLIPNKIEFLKKCCEDISSYLCWGAIKILKNNNWEPKFLEEISKKYFASKKTDYLSNALNISFYLNKDYALQNYIFFLENIKIENDLARPDGFAIENLSNYTVLNEIHLLERLFEIVYDAKNVDFEYHHSKSFLENLVYQLSKTEKGFFEVRNVLFKIRDNIKNNDSHIFYINHLIEKCENSYYESLAKPLTFQQAKNLIWEIENLTIKTIQIMEQFNFGENSTFNGNQFGGKENMQTNYFNAYSSNTDVSKVQQLIEEFDQIQIANEEWKNIFMDGMRDLMELKEAKNEEEEKQSKTNLRKFHDFIVDIGKKTNDWKNLVFLPVELHDKVPKLMEMGNYLGKILGISNT